METTDLAIIGSGSAAFAAAIRARDTGARVTMIERAVVGGTCVNVGCVPSKTLLRAGELRHRAAQHPFGGVTTSADGVDLGALVAQKDALVGHLRQTKYVDLIEVYGIEFVHGDARFSAEPGTLLVGDRTVLADRIVIATGARPALPDLPGLAAADPLTSTSALELDRVPDRLVVIGGGYIALELGQLFAHLGSRVTVVARSTLMRHEEPQVAETMLRVLADDGIEVIEHAHLDRVERSAAGRALHLSVDGNERTIDCDQILVATGRRANTDTLDLAAAGIATDQHGAIRVTPDLRTSNDHVWAAGDVVAAAPAFVYVAARMGATAATNALEHRSDTLDYAALPQVVFTTPQIARTGLTDHEATRRGIDCSCRTLPLDAVPRALANHDTRGFVKLVVDRQSRRLIGATIVADGAGDAIQAAVYAIELGATSDQLAQIWAPYLTFSEGLRLAAQTFTRDVTKLSCCAA